MPISIANIRLLKGAGVLGDRTAKSASLQFRRFNLIYGFNGSGKSTLSRVFASLEGGSLDPKLPSNSSFDVVMDDGTIFGCPAKPNGLERKVLVFNSDFQEKNFQWASGLASPVFFIGEDQAVAGAKLSELEAAIPSLVAQQAAAEQTKKSAEKALVTFRRDRARVTAPRLHLGNRKYEAPQLTADFEQWHGEKGGLLSDDALSAAEDIRKLAEPMPKLEEIAFDIQNIERARASVAEMCEQSLSEITLDELKRFPDMLLWVKQGYEFHTTNDQAECLLCGNPLSAARKEILGAALDNKIDQFIARLKSTHERLGALLSSVSSLEQSAPALDAISTDFRSNLRDQKASLSRSIKQVSDALSPLNGAINSKISRPASAMDVSGFSKQGALNAAAEALRQSLEAINGSVVQHNNLVDGFASHKENAGVAIRKHFIAECHEEFSEKLEALNQADTALSDASEALIKANDEATELRNAIRTHGPAATAINRLIASYLGHAELAISPVDRGYEIHRHGKAITGLPSEGEKTAIVICYFLSTIESEGRKLKDLIIVVDDPVSSLDSKALNYACTLVRSRLSGAAQLFVLTHNQQCMNEFRKAWKNLARPPEGKEPAAALFFLDVVIPEGGANRVSSMVEMSKLLREYDSEYHFLFQHVLKFQAAGSEHYDHGYMMPNILRRVLDVFLAFKCPGNTGLPGKIEQLCKEYPGLDRDRLSALERLSQVESHSDNLDDLISFSSMTIEETRDATNSLLQMMEHVDTKHLAGLRHICR